MSNTRVSSSKDLPKIKQLVTLSRATKQTIIVLIKPVVGRGVSKLPSGSVACKLSAEADDHWRFPRGGGKSDEPRAPNLRGTGTFWRQAWRDLRQMRKKLGRLDPWEEVLAVAKSEELGRWTRWT